MKRPNFLKLIAIYVGIVLFFILLLPIGKSGAEENTREIDITLAPAQQLFNVHNIKPGDWMTRTLKVQNKGNQDFVYQSSASHLSGSELLYNQLEMTVSAGSAVLYEGKLSGFTGFEKRPLAHLEEEELTYTVEFPYESGNEFQGLTTKVAFYFAAEMRPEEVAESVGAIPVTGNPPTFGNVLPKTGEVSPMIFYLSGFIILLLGCVMYRRKMEPMIWTLEKGRSQ